MAEPGLIPKLALLLYVPVCLSFFFFLRPHVAALVGFLAGAMFLPELAEFDFPGVPPFDKKTIATTAVLIGVILKSPRRGKLFTAFGGLGVMLPLTMLFALGTGLTNQDPLWYGPRFLPPIGLSDGVSMAIRDFLRLAIPFMVGKALFHRREHLYDLLRLLATFALVYSFFILIEVKMSPQFHNWVYGYQQHSFLQTIRWGGYRPMVFMEHGLAVGMFTAAAIIATASLARAKRQVVGFPAKALVFYLIFILLIEKSLGALLYGVMGALAVALFRGHSQARLASVLAVLVLTYPVLQASGIFPTEELINFFNSIAPDRAQSLEFRLVNEEQLLEKARERILFGWGEFGRNMVYHPEEGFNMSVTDGYWTILLGVRGALGFVPVFLLLLVPVITSVRRVKWLKNRSTEAMLGGLALIQAFHVLDLLPNGLFTDMPFFLAGALIGLQKGVVIEEEEEEELEADLFVAAETGPPPGRATPAPAGDPFDPNWQPNPPPRPS